MIFKKELYTKEEAAEIVGMSVSWIDRMMRLKKIQYILLGRNRRIKAEEIKRILRKGTILF